MAGLVDTLTGTVETVAGTIKGAVGRLAGGAEDPRGVASATDEGGKKAARGKKDRKATGTAKGGRKKAKKG